AGRQASERSPVALPGAHAAGRNFGTRAARRSIMTPCRFEADVLAAVTAGAWDRAPDALTAHATTCRACSDLVLVSGLLQDEHAAAIQQADVPSSGQVWWRAQVRARAEAAHAAARPLFVAQAVAAAAAIGALVALVSWLWPADVWHYASTP